MELVQRAVQRHPDTATQELVNVWVSDYEMLRSEQPISETGQTPNDLVFRAACRALAPQFGTRTSLNHYLVYGHLWPPGETDITLATLLPFVRDIQKHFVSIDYTPRVLERLIYMIMGVADGLPPETPVADLYMLSTFCYRMLQMVYGANCYRQRCFIELPSLEPLVRWQQLVRTEADKGTLTGRNRERFALGTMAAHMHVGDYDLYRRLFPKAHADVPSVFRHFYGSDRFLELYRLTNTHESDLIDYPDDYITSALCKLYLLQHYLESRFSIDFIDEFVIFSDQAMDSYELVCQQGHPMLVMDFNRFGVYSEGMLYQSLDFDTAVVWFFVKSEFVLNGHAIPWGAPNPSPRRCSASSEPSETPNPPSAPCPS